MEAPNWVDPTCKTTADRLVASGTDNSSLEDLSQALQKSFSNIKVLTIDWYSHFGQSSKTRTSKKYKNILRHTKSSPCSQKCIYFQSFDNEKFKLCLRPWRSHFILVIFDYSKINSKPGLHIEYILYVSISDSDDEPWRR